MERGARPLVRDIGLGTIATIWVCGLEGNFVAGVIECSIRLELTIAEVMKLLAERVDDLGAKILLRFIARESENHAKTLRDIATLLSLPSGTILGGKECRRFLGVMGAEALGRYEELLEKLRKGWRPTPDEVIQLIDDELARYEEVVGEELVAGVLYKILEEVARREEVQLLLRSIREDEQEHTRMLRMVRNLIRSRM